MQIRICGDVHGKQDAYINLTKGCDYSIQLGDMGFNYDKLNILDSSKHFHILGNHEKVHTDSDGNLLRTNPYVLENFGMVKFNNTSNIPDMFYVRGEHSIDKGHRIDGVNWFKDEQLTYHQMIKAVDFYAKMKPEIVLSHGCPANIIPKIANPDFAYMNLAPSATAGMLQAMFEAHQPKFWFFGHYHFDRTFKVNGTRFFCLDELSSIDIVDHDDKYIVDAQYVKFSNLDMDNFYHD